jgi:D-beta-D-heptose 7-phosphate kinase/D-beta-D-heptose 1-phosphate adenosyltransferase
VNKARDAAGISITKIGNYQLNQFDLKKDKVIEPTQIKELSKFLKNKFSKIVFTNGVFDIIHAGHIDLFQKAKRLGDILIVAINDDVSVKRNKGPSRPINNIKKRLKVLSSIKFIDYLVVFKEKTPLNLIRDLKPNILVKGADYKLNQIVGAKEVKKNNGLVKIIQFKYNLSSTSILKKYELK